MPPRSDSRGREVARPGAKSLGLFQQHRMAGQRLAVGAAERHVVAFNVGPFAEIVICRENLSSAIDESAHRLGVTPAEGSAPNIPRDASQRVVVRSCADITRPRPGLRQESGFCPPGTSSRRSSHMPSAM